MGCVLQNAIHLKCQLSLLCDTPYHLPRIAAAFGWKRRLRRRRRVRKNRWRSNPGITSADVPDMAYCTAILCYPRSVAPRAELQLIHAAAG